MNIKSHLQLFTFLISCIALSHSVPSIAAEMMAQPEREAAAQHAGFAGKAMSIAETRLHLQHVINCLVGPGGADFDAESGNPCSGKGNGALNAMNLSMQEKQRLQQALALAKEGIELNKPEAVQAKAKAVKVLLQNGM